METPSILFGDSENEDEMLSKVFHATLCQTQSSLLKVLKVTSPYCQKRTLMKWMHSTRTIYGRLLLLYRSYQNNNNSHTLDPTTATLEKVFRQTNLCFADIRKFRKQFRDKEITYKFPYRIHSKTFHYFNLFDLYQQSIPQSIQTFYRTGKLLTMISRGYRYSYTITQSKSGKYKITQLTIQWPNIPAIDKKSIVEQTIQKCQNIINTSPRFLNDLDKYLLSCCLQGEILRICDIIRQFSSSYGFRISYSDSIQIQFPFIFHPHNFFYIKSNKLNYVHLISLIPSFNKLANRVNSNFYQIELTNLSYQELEAVINRLHHILHFSKIQSIAQKLKESLTDHTNFSIVVNEEAESITALYFGYFSFQIRLDFLTGEPVISRISIPQLKGLLLRAIKSSSIECCQLMRIFSSVSLLIELFGHPHGFYIAQNVAFDLISPLNCQYVVYNPTYADQFIIKNPNPNHGLDIYHRDVRIVHKNLFSIPNYMKIESITDFYPSCFYQVQQTLILTELASQLRLRGIESYIFKNKLTFSNNSFPAIVFSVKNQHWSIHFTNNERSLGFKIIGGRVYMRFCNWFVPFFEKLNSLIEFKSQLLKIRDNNALIKNIDEFHFFNYRIIFDPHVSSPVTINTSGIQFQTKKHNCDVFTLTNHNISSSSYLYLYSAISTYITSLLKSSSYSSPVTFFFNVSFSALCKICRIFQIGDSPNWIILYTQPPFLHLIYRGQYTLRFQMRSSQTLSISLPNKFKFLFSAIPSNVFVMEKVNGVINISQLNLLYDSFNLFFHEKEVVEKWGFSSPIWYDHRQYEYSKPPERLPYLKCFLNENGIQVQLNTRSAPKYMKTLLNINIDDRKHRETFLCFIFDCLNIGENGPELIQVLSELTDMDNLINWQQTLDGLFNVNLDEQKAIFKLNTKFKVYLFEIPLRKDADRVFCTGEEGYQISEITSISKIRTYFKQNFNKISASIPSDDEFLYV